MQAASSQSRQPSPSRQSPSRQPSPSSSSELQRYCFPFKLAKQSKSSLSGVTSGIPISSVHLSSTKTISGFIENSLRSAEDLAEAYDTSRQFLDLSPTYQGKLKRLLISYVIPRLLLFLLFQKNIFCFQMEKIQI